MENTITVGDHLLVNKFIFAPGPMLPILPQRDIRRADIIVFKYPGNPFNPDRDRDDDNIPFKVNYVKRVIGLPGDTVEVRGLKVYVNGQPLPEHVIAARNVNEKGPLEIAEDPPHQPGELYNVFYFPENVQAAREGHDLRMSPDFPFSRLTASPRRCHPILISSWVTIATTVSTAAPGVCPARPGHRHAMFVYWSYDETKFNNPSISLRTPVGVARNDGEMRRPT
jgi:signal peptidase I